MNNDEHVLTGAYYPESEYERHEGKIPNGHSIESTSEALLVDEPVAEIGYDKVTKESVVTIYCNMPSGIHKVYLANSNGRWVSIEDDVPANNVNVLGYYGDNENHVVNQVEGDWVDALAFETIGTPTHWMPLPAPPKD